MYEPIHGSAPDIAGRGIANPIGTIASVAMMLRHSLALAQEAELVETAIHEAIDAGALTADVAPKGERPRSTSEVGDAIVSRIVGTRVPVPA
jgi:3-isopropylmalate dehydrogenase